MPVCAPAISSPQTSLPRPLVALFACASGLSVANVYYAQPLLDALAADFAISQAAIGGVVTATQVGCLLALLLLVPLGDRFDRRRLMLGQALGLAVMLILVAMADSPVALLGALLGVGLLGTAMTQGLIAYAASAAPAQQRGRVVGAAQGGVFIGLLLARVLAGGMSDLVGWRGLYLFSAALMLSLAVLLCCALPRLPRSPLQISYARLIGSLPGLLRTERVLQIRGVIALLMFAALNIFWSALVLPLSAPPHEFSHTAIGAFGLVGIVGALAAARAGHWADRGAGQRTTGWALLLLALAWLPLSWLDVSLVALLAGIVLLDLAGQAIHVTNQSLILRTAPHIHSRLIGAYMLFYAVGSGLGALATTQVYSVAGWGGVCLLGAGVSLLALGFWAATVQYMPAPGPLSATAPVRGVPPSG